MPENTRCERTKEATRGFSWAKVFARDVAAARLEGGMTVSTDVRMVETIDSQTD